MANDNVSTDVHMEDIDKTTITLNPRTLTFSSNANEPDQATLFCEQSTKTLRSLLRPSDLSGLGDSQKVDFVTGLLSIPPQYTVKLQLSNGPRGVKRRAGDPPLASRHDPWQLSDTDDDTDYETGYEPVVFAPDEIRSNMIAALREQMGRLRTGSPPVLLGADLIVSPNLLCHEARAAANGTPLTMSELINRQDTLSDLSQVRTGTDADQPTQARSCYYFDNGILMLTPSAAEDKELQILCEFGEVEMSRSVTAFGHGVDTFHLTAAVTNVLQLLAESVEAKESLKGLLLKYGGQRFESKTWEHAMDEEQATDPNSAVEEDRSNVNDKGKGKAVER